MDPHSSAVLTVRRSAEHSVGLPPLAPFGRKLGSKGLGSLALGLTTMQPCSLHWPKGGGVDPLVPFHMYLCVQHGMSCPEFPSQDGLPMPHPFENQKQAWPLLPVKLRLSLPACAAEGCAHLIEWRSQQL